MATHTYNRGPVEPELYRPDNPRQRRITYIAIGAALLAMLIVGLFTSQAHAETKTAVARAHELTTQLEQAGLPTPRMDQIVRTLGDDGGAVCASPDSALKVAMGRAAMFNGATGPGARPVISARNIVDGERLIIKTYCPDQLAEYDEFVNSHQYADVIKT